MSELKLQQILEADIISPVWEVICASVSRYKGEDEKKARAIFQEFSDKADSGFGEVGHEPVILSHDGMLVEIHTWAGPKK
jgi:hypothetical protein